MRSVRYVFHRAAFALGLLAIGVGSGIGMPPADVAVQAPDCPAPARVFVATGQDRHADGSVAITRVLLVRRPDAAS